MEISDLNITKQNISMNESEYKTESLNSSFQENADLLKENDDNSSVIDKESVAQSFKDSFVAVEKDSILKVEKEKPEEPRKMLSVLDMEVRISESDSDKMKAVKEQLSRYQRVKGTIMEAPVLYELIQACNRYTSFKFSFLKFGKASRRLKEVQAIRDDAWKQWIKVAAKIKNTSPEEKKKIRAKMKETVRKEPKFFAPEVKHYIHTMPVNKVALKEGIQDVRAKMALLKKTYPGISSKDAEDIAIETIRTNTKITDMTTTWMDEELSKYKKYDGIVEVRRYLEKRALQNRMDKEEELERRREQEKRKRQEKEAERKKQAEEARERREQERILNNKLDRIKDEILDQHNAISRFFLRNIFGGLYLENKALKIISGKDYQEKTDGTVNIKISEANEYTSKSDMDYETTFI